ncbi:MAG TPA: LegC family aminotransferase [Lacunisphaera sp.]|jgi:perosamine synthetase
MKSTEKLAPGAPPPSGFIPLIVPEIRGNEWQYVKDCLDTTWVSSVGSYVDRFEQMVAQKAGTKYAVATVNGTSALHIALLIAGIKPEDEVLVSTLTFIAPVNAIRYAGAWPVFIDAEPKYWQMDTTKVVDFLEQGCRWSEGALYNRSTGRKVVAVMPVHVLGHPVDLDPILALAKKFGLVVIEDATEGLGAEYKNRGLGGLAHIGCFSFNGNKIITTGGGGMLVTNNSEWATRAKYLTTQAKDDPVEYIHGEIGYNYRLTNLLAAVGCAQMEQLDSYVAAKRTIAARYMKKLQHIRGITPMGNAPWAESTFWMYTVLVNNELFGMDSRQLMRALGTLKIQCRPLWQPIHQSPAHATNQPVSMPVAEQLTRQGLSLPCSVGLTEIEQDKVIAAILESSKQSGG